MHRFAALVLALLAFGLGGMSIGHAAVRKYDKLSFPEQLALQTSEHHVAIYDQELATLDHQRRQHKISADDYVWKSTTLTFYIQQESQFQNAIMVHKVDLGQSTADFLKDAGTVAIAIPTYTLIGVAYILGHCSGLHGSFSP
jgi:hypothetical protein